MRRPSIRNDLTGFIALCDLCRLRQIGRQYIHSNTILLSQTPGQRFQSGLVTRDQNQVVAAQNDSLTSPCLPERRGGTGLMMMVDI